MQEKQQMQNLPVFAAFLTYASHIYGVDKIGIFIHFGHFIHILSICLFPSK